MESMYYNFHYCSCFAQKEERQEAVIDALCGLFGDNAKDQLIQYEDHDWGKEPYNGGCPDQHHATWMFDLLPQCIKGTIRQVWWTVFCVELSCRHVARPTSADIGVAAWRWRHM